MKNTLIIIGICLLGVLLIIVLPSNNNQEEIISIQEADIVLPSNNNQEEIISTQEAEELIMSFINDYLLMGQAQAQLLDISVENNLYKLKLNIQGEEFYSYSTLDGKLFFPEGMNIKETIDMISEVDMAEEEIVVEKEVGDIPDLVSCLKEQEFVIYGANWCGYCKQVIDLFKDHNIDSIYVECTQEQELCQKENITGYPTIKIKGERYTGQRTLEAFALSANCSI